MLKIPFLLIAPYNCYSIKKFKRFLCNVLIFVGRWLPLQYNPRSEHEGGGHSRAGADSHQAQQVSIWTAILATILIKAAAQIVHTVMYLK